jgi:hypothetical protein
MPANAGIHDFLFRYTAARCVIVNPIWSKKCPLKLAEDPGTTGAKVRNCKICCGGRIAALRFKADKACRYGEA